MQSKFKTSMILLVLTLVFLAPGITAYWYYRHPHQLSTLSTNQGRLLDVNLQWQTLSPSSKWELMLWYPERCEQQCMDKLQQMGRIRLALGRLLYQLNVRLLTPATNQALDDVFASVLQDEAIQTSSLSSAEANALMTSLGLMSNQGQILIANPDLKLVLAYPVSSPPAAVFHDLKRLLTKG